MRAFTQSFKEFVFLDFGWAGRTGLDVHSIKKIDGIDIALMTPIFMTKRKKVDLSSGVLLSGSVRDRHTTKECEWKGAVIAMGRSEE
jgi:hypothetical protein